MESGLIVGGTRDRAREMVVFTLVCDPSGLPGVCHITLCPSEIPAPMTCSSHTAPGLVCRAAGLEVQAPTSQDLLPRTDPLVPEPDGQFILSTGHKGPLLMPWAKISQSFPCRCAPGAGFPDLSHRVFSHRGLQWAEQAAQNQRPPS